MRTLIVPANVAPCQVDDFPEDCERSRKGAIYLRPASACKMTDAEYEHLKEFHSDLFNLLIEAKPHPTVRVKPARELSMEDLMRAHKERVKKETAGLGGFELRKKVEELSKAAPDAPQPAKPAPMPAPSKKSDKADKPDK